jgi:hypothetical protein
MLSLRVHGGVDPWPYVSPEMQAKSDQKRYASWGDIVHALLSGIYFA